MTRMDLTGPRATCIHVTSFTQDKYVGSQCDNRGRFVATTSSLILDLLKCFWMNHRSYWCHHGLVSWILDSVTASDGFCRKRHSILLELPYCTINFRLKRLLIFVFTLVSQWLETGFNLPEMWNDSLFLYFLEMGELKDQKRDQTQHQQRGQQQM